MVYYAFAIIGMEVFHGKIHFLDPGSGSPDALVCGNPALKDSAFAQGRYCKNNFNDLASSLILLTELTVVNQWHNILSEEAAWWGMLRAAPGRRRKWEPAPVFFPGKSRGQRSLAGYSPGVTKSGTRLSN